ncbi:MAG: hypothetical protein JXB39_08425 [Deltaproteobacteria bacterium]|nr:hypothetical protein [Deltaproteobacteria bacterium]
MLLSLFFLLLGMIPLPHAPIRSGPPAAHLDRRPAVQWALSTRPAWQDFQDAWGGAWGVRWDERNGTPRFLYVPGVPLSQADALLEDVARLAGTDPAGFELASEVRRGQQVLRRWTRTWQGAEVVGDQVLMVAKEGRIGGVWVQVTPIAPCDPIRPGEVVLPVPRFPAGREWIAPSNGVRGVPGWVERDGTTVTWRDREGQALLCYDERMTGAITVTHEVRTQGGAIVEDPAREVTVVDTLGTSDITDVDGHHDLEGGVTVTLEGPSLWVLQDGSGVRVSGSADLVLDAGTDLSYAAADVLHNFHVVWDWLADRWPTHAWLDDQVPANVGFGCGHCNAWYTSGTLTFLPPHPDACNDFGRIADVLYHEVGHGIHEYILAGGTRAGDVSEGAADFVSCTINDDPQVAPNAYVDGGYLREIASDRVYPDDVTGEPHNDGLIFSSFLWDLREAWIDAYGVDGGVERADVLFLGTLEQGPTLTDVAEAVLVADDDNGDLSDGTPHACALLDLLDAHGLGPGPLGLLVFDHDPLEDQPSDALHYEVRFSLTDVSGDCEGRGPPGVRLWYTLSDAEVPDVDGGKGSDAWEEVSLLEEKEGGWIGVIPRQPANTRVRYTMEAVSTDGSQAIATHEGRDEGAWTFWVGDQERLWCEGFEAGAPGFSHGPGTPARPDTAGTCTDEWSYGTPDGAGPFDPDRPWEGATVAATSLNANYSALNRQYLKSPTLDLTGAGPMLLLSFRRWLTVEDALYDHAYLWAGDTLLYENPSSADGSQHVLDMGWTLRDVPIEGALDSEGRIAFAWTLLSDSGLEFGGWALDDVCVVALADVPGHYRVRDLVATDEAEVVSITWTQPWVAPLSRTLLLRKQAGWPEGPGDGEVLDDDTAPLFGASRRVSDPDVAPGERWYYAVFTADGDGTFHLAVVEGENADEGGRPSPEGDTSEGIPDTGTPTTDDTGAPRTDDTAGADPPNWSGTPGPHPVGDTGAPRADDTAEPEDRGPGCGCGSGPTRGGWTALLLALVLLGRRRSAGENPRAPDPTVFVRDVGA